MPLTGRIATLIAVLFVVSCGGTGARYDGPSSEIELNLLVDTETNRLMLADATELFEDAGVRLRDDFDRFFVYELYRDSLASEALVCGTVESRHVDGVRPYGPRGDATVRVRHGLTHHGVLPSSVSLRFSTSVSSGSQAFSALEGDVTCLLLGRERDGEYQLWRNAWLLPVYDGEIRHGSLALEPEDLLSVLEPLFEQN